MTPRLIYANSEHCADLYYASGFFAPDEFLWLRDPQGQTHIVTSALEIDRARRTSKAHHVHDWHAILQQARTKKGVTTVIPLAELTAFFLKSQNVIRAETPSDFPMELADNLRRLGITLYPCSGPYWPQRQCKTPAEVEAIRHALVITAQGMTAGINMIRASSIHPDGLLYLDGSPLTSERVRGEINATLIRQGAAPHRTIVAGGTQAADPHEMGSGHLPAHFPIILDVFPRVENSGYWGDMTRTVCKGTASDRARNAWNAVLQAQETAFARIQDGVSGLDIHTTLTQNLTNAGFPTEIQPDGRQGGFFHGTGHGLGLEIHEAPRISQRDDLLKSGHVVTVEPGLYYPDMGGVRLEDVVLVEPDGCRNLTVMPKFFEI